MWIYFRRSVTPSKDVKAHQVYKRFECVGVRVSLIWPFVSLSIYVLLSIFGLVSLEALRTVSVIKLLIAAAFCAFCFNLGKTFK